MPVCQECNRFTWDPRATAQEWGGACGFYDIPRNQDSRACDHINQPGKVDPLKDVAPRSGPRKPWGPKTTPVEER